MLPQRGWGHPWHRAKWKVQPVAKQTLGSKRKPLHKHLYLFACFYSIIFYVPSFCCGGNKREGRRKKKAQKQNDKKAKKSKLREKGGGSGEVQRGSVRHTNPYLKRWRLIQLPQLSQRSGNDGLWEGEGIQKAIIWCPGTRWDLNHWVCRDKHI